MGLANYFDLPRAFIDAVYNDLFPSTTRDLASWEAQFGLSPGATDTIRRLNITGAWQAGGGQSPRYLQDVVRSAGFDVYIHEWWDGTVPRVARDPRDYTEEPIIGTVQCGEPLAQCGEPTAMANAFLANEPGYIVNLNLTDRAPPGIPSDSSKWPYFLYWGGEVFGDRSLIEARRRAEFEALILKICPAQHWLVTMVDYVDEVIDEDGNTVTDADGNTVVAYQ